MCDRGKIYFKAECFPQVFHSNTSASATALAEKPDKTGQNLSYYAANKAGNALDFFY